MVGHGGSSAGSCLADPTSPILSHCAVITVFKSVPSASIVVNSTYRVNPCAACKTLKWHIYCKVTPSTHLLSIHQIV